MGFTGHMTHAILHSMPPNETVRHSRLINAIPFHYGWVVLAAGSFGALMTTPGQTVGMSAFFDPITTSLGVSREVTALAYTFGTLAGVLPAPLVGRWIDQRGPRLAVTAIAVALALACVGMAFVNSALALFFGFAALRGAAVGALSLVSLHVVNLWFVRKRGLATAAATMGLALGAIVFPRVIDPLISMYGWRGAYIALAAFLACTILPVGAGLFRDRPERFGLQPDLGLRLGGVGEWTEPAFTREQALRTGMFWLLGAASFLSNGIGTGLLLHHFAIMSSEGLARPQALNVLTALAIAQVIATLGTGALIDRWEARRALALPMLSLASACILAQSIASIGTGLFYAVAIGVALGSFHAINASAYANYFGRTHLGAIRGVSFVIAIVGAACGPLPFAVGQPVSDAYDLVLSLSAIACVGVAVASIFIRAPTATVAPVSR